MWLGSGTHGEVRGGEHHRAGDRGHGYHLEGALGGTGDGDAPQPPARDLIVELDEGRPHEPAQHAHVHEYRDLPDVVPVPRAVVGRGVVVQAEVAVGPQTGEHEARALLLLAELDEPVQREDARAGGQEAPPEDVGGVERAAFLDGEEGPPDGRGEGGGHAGGRADGGEVPVVDVVAEDAPPAPGEVQPQRPAAHLPDAAPHDGAPVHEGPLLARDEPRPDEEHDAHELGHEGLHLQEVGEVDAVEVGLELGDARARRQGLHKGDLATGRGRVRHGEGEVDEVGRHEAAPAADRAPRGLVLERHEELDAPVHEERDDALGDPDEAGYDPLEEEAALVVVVRLPSPDRLVQQRVLWVVVDALKGRRALQQRVVLPRVPRVLRGALRARACGRLNVWAASWSERSPIAR